MAQRVLPRPHRPEASLPHALSHRFAGGPPRDEPGPRAAEDPFHPRGPHRAHPDLPNPQRPHARHRVQPARRPGTHRRRRPARLPPAWQAAPAFDPARPLKPWLYAITRRAAVDIHRRERRTTHEVSLDGTSDYNTALSTTDPRLDQTWQTWQVREALDRLHPDERTVLRLAYYDGSTQSQIATLLHTAIGTVKSRTVRAQRHLAELLSHLNDNSHNRPANKTLTASVRP